MSQKKSVFSTEAAVIINQPAGEQYWRLVLEAPEIVALARPGQFVNLRVTRTLEPLLARPFGIFNCDLEQGNLELLYNVAGRGTEILTGVKPGERLSVSGPLGNGFTPEAQADLHLAIGGGTGVAPICFLAGSLQPEHETWMLFGYRNSSFMLPGDLVERTGAHCRTALDQGGAGCFHGTVIDLLRNLLDGELSGRRIALYVAGPPIMMKLAAEMAAEREIPCQVSLEERMACGLGVCRGCVVQAEDLRGQMANRTICTFGPVFPGAAVDWQSYLKKS
jgi:dihydroorotate dehydrogenase electron transfer subunit